MEKKISSYNSALTQAYKRGDDLYHRYAVHFGLSDPAVWILYALYGDTEKTYTQNDFASMWFYPKQTVNYTVGVLVKRGLVTLSQQAKAGNSKAVRLTDEGISFCKEKIFPLLCAEESSFSRLTEQEKTLLLSLTEKQIGYFEEEINKITGEKN